MKKLIVLNYQREIPPFMLIELKYAKKSFDKIIYITPTLYNDNSSLVVDKKLSVVQLGFVQRVKSFLKMPFKLLRKESISDLKLAFKMHNISADFLKHLGTELFVSDIIETKARKIIKKSCKKNEIYVLATWFSSEAYAVSRLKKRFNDIKAVSFAHAFEINPERNKYVDISLNYFKHFYLDKISFISENMKDIYLNAYKIQDAMLLKKMDIQYLGCEKKSSKSIADIQKENDVFNICSCAGMTSVKRIDLIINSLKNLTKYNVKWTHLGGGPLYESIFASVKKLHQSNPNISVNLMGKLTNDQVHDFYNNNYIDLFINTSESEGLPVSIMEAMAYSIPVIATDVGGTSEIVNDSNGFIVSKDATPLEIKNIIESYIEVSDSIKQEYRTAAIEQWEKKFNADINVTEYFYKLTNERI